MSPSTMARPWDPGQGCGSPAPPNASTLNFAAAPTVPNAAIVSLGTAGIGLYNGSSGTTHVIVDEQGYFIAPPA